MRPFRLAIAATLLAQGALARAPTPAPASGTTPAAPTTGPDASGVVHPQAKVDPGMTVIRPRMPAGSTPVIKPPSRTQDGTVVVPR